MPRSLPRARHALPVGRLLSLEIPILFRAASDWKDREQWPQAYFDVRIMELR